MLVRFLTRGFLEEDTGAPAGSDRPKVADVLQEYGRDAIRLAEKLADAQSDNFSLREKNRALRAENTQLKERVPADDLHLLKPDEYALWEAYRSIGTPEELKRRLTEQEEAQAEVSRLKRADTVRAAAEAVGFKPNVLATLVGALPIEIKPVKDGKPIAYVVTDGEEKALEDYATEQWADFLPALRTSPTLAPDINAGAKSNGEAPLITDEQRRQAAARYRATF